MLLQFLIQLIKIVLSLILLHGHGFIYHHCMSSKNSKIIRRIEKKMKNELKEIKHYSIGWKTEKQIDRRSAPRLETAFIFDKIVSSVKTGISCCEIIVM